MSSIKFPTLDEDKQWVKCTSSCVHERISHVIIYYKNFSSFFILFDILIACCNSAVKFFTCKNDINIVAEKMYFCMLKGTQRMCILVGWAGRSKGKFMIVRK